MKTHVKSFAYLTIILLTLSVIAYAVVTVTIETPATVTVLSIYGAEFLTYPNQTSVTQIAFPQLKHNQTVYSQNYVIKNVGDYPLYFAYQIINISTYLTCVGQVYDQPTNEWYDFNQDNYFSLGGLIEVGQLTKPLRFKLTASATTPNGDYTFTVYIHGATTSSG